FSSRRWHTSSSRDWSSDVCSSDVGIMILLHGYGGSKEAMLWLANYYRFLGYHVIVPDLKGHGASTRDEPGFGVEDVDVLLALIDSLPARERQIGRGHVCTPVT